MNKLFTILVITLLLGCNKTETIEPCVEVVWFLDADGDGLGNPNVPLLACEKPDFFVSNLDDDNDNPDVTAMEDCEQTWFFDRDGDGYGSTEFVVLSCTQPDHFVSNFDDFNDNDPNLNPDSIWSGPKITITKESNTSFALQANQDRITDNVWLSRGERGGLINVVEETTFNRYSSPEGTYWARGTTDDIGKRPLQFSSFRTTLNYYIGNQIIDTDLVLYILEDAIFIDVKFTHWENSTEGAGYSYERSTKH